MYEFWPEIEDHVRKPLYKMYKKHLKKKAKLTEQGLWDYYPLQHVRVNQIPGDPDEWYLQLRSCIIEPIESFVYFYWTYDEFEDVVFPNLN